MDYKKTYDRLVCRAKNRKLECYKEIHHIIPKCMGGTEDKNNLVELTAREHFICHWLLSRMYPKDAKLSYSFWMMSTSKRPNRYIPSSRVYEEAKQLQSLLRSEQLKGHLVSEKTKEKISKANKGKKRTEEERKRISDSLKGKKGNWEGKTHSEKSKQKMRESKIGNKASDETKKKMSESSKGLKRTEKQKEELSMAMRGISKKKHECQFCKRLIGGLANLDRHEAYCKKIFDNVIQIKEI